LVESAGTLNDRRYAVLEQHRSAFALMLQFAERARLSHRELAPSQEHFNATVKVLVGTNKLRDPRLGWALRAGMLDTYRPNRFSRILRKEKAP
jgi:hypothetical protein